MAALFSHAIQQGPRYSRIQRCLPLRLCATAGSHTYIVHFGMEWNNIHVVTQPMLRVEKLIHSPLVVFVTARRMIFCPTTWYIQPTTDYNLCLTHS